MLKITKKKLMPDEMKHTIDSRLNSNLVKYNVTANHPKLLNYQRYNPFTH